MDRDPVWHRLFDIAVISNFEGGGFLERIVYDFGHFADFFDHIRRFYLGLGNVYEEGMHACFPPLAYCMYGMVARILCLDNAGNPDGLDKIGRAHV